MELFGSANYRNYTKIAIATRYSGTDLNTRAYIQALVAQGYNVRVMSQNSAMEDFCAMRHAVDLVGMVRSTFVVWAALLGNHTARLYSVDSLSTRKHSQKKGHSVFRTYNWTHPELQRRIQFELYQSEDMEEQLATIGG
jgi:excinuclease UvrABC helicase subunit UvrB